MAKGKSFIFHIAGKNDTVPVPPPGKYHYYFNENDPSIKALNAEGKNVDLGGVPVSNTLFVAKNQSILPSEKGKLSKSFSSIQSAIDAASSGDVVFVFPGIYEEGITIKDGVNLHFYNGAILQLEQARQMLIQDNSNKINCNITGEGVFRMPNMDSSQVAGSAMLWFLGGGNINFECKELYQDGQKFNVGGAVARAFNGTRLHIKVDQLIQYTSASKGMNGVDTDTNSIITMQARHVVGEKNTCAQGGSSDYGIFDIKAENIISIKRRGLSFAIGRYICNRIYGFEYTAVPGEGKLFIEADELSSQGNCIIDIHHAGYRDIMIKNANIIAHDSNHNPISIETSVNRMVLENCYTKGGQLRSNQSQDVIIKGNLLTDRSPTSNINFTGGSQINVSDPNFFGIRYRFFWTDGICVKDSQGNNTGDYRRKKLKSLKVINGNDLVVSTDSPPSENHNDEYVLDQSGSPNASWDGASQGDHVKFDSGSSQWNVVQSVPSDISSYIRREYDITNSFSWGSPYGTVNLFSYSSLTDDQFAKLSSPDYNQRLGDFYTYVYYQTLFDNNDWDNFDPDKTDILVGEGGYIYGNLATNNDENANGPASGTTNINCPV